MSETPGPFVDVEVDAAAPPNQCPTATIDSVQPSSTVPTNTEVTVDASSSNDPDGDVESYLWVWGDGDTGLGPAIHRHTYSDDGHYVITVAVIDDDGCTYNPEAPATHSARTTATVTVTNQDPVAVLTLTPNGTAEPGQDITFDTVDSEDPDGTIVTRSIAFGDGRTWNLTDGDVARAFNYPSEGVFTATLTITDDDGATATDSKTITIEEYVAPPDRSGTYDLDVEISVLCGGTIDLSGNFIWIVDYEFSAVTIAESGSSTVRPEFVRIDPPGLMTGTFSDLDFFASRTIEPGLGLGCAEFYTFDVTFSEDGTTFDGAFNAEYVVRGAPWGSCGSDPPCSSYSADIIGTLRTD